MVEKWSKFPLSENTQFNHDNVWRAYHVRTGLGFAGREKCGDCSLLCCHTWVDLEPSAILKVTKLVKAESCHETHRAQLFEALGFSFVNRLLKTSRVPADCPEHSYRELAVSVLSCFSSVKHLAQHPAMYSNITAFNDIISASHQESASEDGIETPPESLVIDTYECLTCIAMQHAGCEALVQHGYLTAASLAISKQLYGCERAVKLTLHIMKTLGGVVWRGHLHSLTLLLNSLAQHFNKDTSVYKFELCEQLSDILYLVQECELREVGGTWREAVCGGLHDVLCSRISSRERNPALRLASMMTERLGVDWALTSQTDPHKFMLLLTHLACIEVRMSLEDKTFSQVVENAAVLSSCYSLLENIISYVTVDSRVDLADGQLAQLHAAFTGSFSAVTRFLLHVQQLHKHQRTEPVVIAAVRVLGSWLAEETHALDEDIKTLLPFLLLISGDMLHACKDPTVSNQLSVAQSCSPESQTLSKPYNTCSSSLSHSHDGDSQSNSQHDRTKQSEPEESIDMCTNAVRQTACVDVLRFLLPGLCHLTAQDETRGILLSTGLLELMEEFLIYEWSLYEQDAQQVQSTAEVAMTTACSVLMNIVVLEKTLISTSDVAGRVLCFITDHMTVLSGLGVPHLVFVFNTAVLGLMILQQQHYLADCDNEGCRTLLTCAVRLFGEVHTSDAKDPPSLSCTRHIEPVWQHIEELWFLGMQTLAHLVGLYKPTVIILEQSEWIPKIIQLLLKVRGAGVDTQTAVSYRVLLIESYRSSASLARHIEQQRGGDLAQLYKFTELSALMNSNK